MRNVRFKRGFTLTELVVIIAVIAIVMLVVVPTFNNVVDNAEGSSALAQAKDLYAEYVRSNSKVGKIDNELYIQVEDGYVYYVDGKPVKNADETYVFEEIYINDDLLNANGKYIESRFKDHESIVNEFIKDFNIFSKDVGYNLYSKNIADYWKSKFDDTSNKVSINKNDVSSTVLVYHGFWESSALNNTNKNYEKWSWIFEVLKNLAQNQSLDTTDLNKMIDNPNFDDSNLENVLQNVTLFFLKANKTTWDSEYQDGYGSLLENTVIDCSSVKFNDYYKFIPRELFINSNYEFEPPIYVIEYDLSEGSFEDPESIVLNYQEGEVVILPTPIKNGYDFTGWYDGENKVEDLTMPGNNISLKARWELSTYAISYDLGGVSFPQYNSVNEIIEDFLKDFNAYSGESYTTSTYYGIGPWPASTDTPWPNKTAAMMLYEANYKNKWSWLVDYIGSVASNSNKAAYTNYYSFANYQKFIASTASLGNYKYMFEYELRGFIGLKQYTRNENFKTADYSTSSVQNQIWNYVTRDFVYSYNMESEMIVLNEVKNSKFLGWYLDGVQVTSIPKGTTGDINLVAKWKDHNKTYLDSILLSYYSNTGNAAGSGSGNSKNYICDKVGINPNNGLGNSLQWQNKILLRYDESKKAYLVVAKNSATDHISASALASNAGVTWTHAICSITNNIQNKVSVGQYIVIDPLQDFSSYYGIDTKGFALTNTYARIYDSDYGN